MDGCFGAGPKPAVHSATLLTKLRGMGSAAS